MITLGGMALLFAIIRVFFFKIPESPRYLLSKGRDAEAVEAVNYIARVNGKPEPLTIDMMMEVDRSLGLAVDNEKAGRKMTFSEIMKQTTSDFKSANVKDMFATRQFARHTTIIWLIWLTIGTLAHTPGDSWRRLTPFFSISFQHTCPTNSRNRLH
jgi:hypothetical protein